MDVSSEKIETALTRYSKEVKETDESIPHHSFHITRANAMRQLLYDLGILNDISNHEVVEAAKMSACAKKKKKQVK